ncbi:MAG: S41 family peptidase [Rhodocyclaceae bacterium]|nr:S41 family peptidase [Rhodocyclaceae bacterium]
MSGSKLQKIGLLVTGVVAGVALSLNFSANATKELEPLPIDELRTFAEVFGAIKSAYVEPVDDKKLFVQAISGMLSGLDPHSAYLDGDAFKDLQVSTHGEFGGLGIEVGMEDGFVKVVSPIEDTPAFRAGVKAGDLIVKLDETPVKGMTLSDAVKRMRGKPKTSITLTIARKGETKPIVVTLVREVIKVQSVKAKVLESGFGYIRLTQFQENTAADMARQLDKMYKAGPVNGLVLDLRNDPGGVLHGAIGVAAAYLPPKSLVVSTDGRTADAKRKFVASPEDYLPPAREDYLQKLPDGVKTVPMVVLVNGGSASASEIVAGALQDHKRALIMGTQTFGKGSVQTVLPLPNNTGIKLTTARYYTPSGRSIQAKGITPDIVVEETANGALNTALRVREADLDHHLSNDRDPDAAAATPAKPEQAPKAKEPAKPAPKTDKPGAGKSGDEDEAKAPIEFGGKNDYQLAQAVNLLKGVRIMQKQ